jgi:hypothetical protein
MAEVGEARTGDQSNVPGAEDGNLLRRDTHAGVERTARRNERAWLRAR